MIVFTYLLAALVNRDTFLRSIAGSPFISLSMADDESEVMKINKRLKFMSSKNMKPNSVIPLTFEDAIMVIQNETPTDFIHAVEKSGKKFLYRGEDIIFENGHDDRIQTCAWMNPEPDLLLRGTYSDDNALAYFNNLEECIKAKETSSILARPSNSHIGTSNILEASKWGKAVSIWPCGNNFSYCFPKNKNDFFNDNINSSSLSNISTNRHKKCDEVLINRDLSVALKSGREVMFSSTDAFGHISSAFVAIPSTYDDQLSSSLFGK